MQKKYNSKGSQLIEAFLEKQKDYSFCVGDVWEYIQEKGENINTTTIYRNLERLEKEGRLITYKSTTSDSTMYQHVAEHQNCHKHLHMRCRECGKIYHLEGELVDQFSKQITEVYGFVLEPQASSVIGLCLNCQKA